MPTPEQVADLADAVEQLLDDMANGTAVSMLAKAKARVAYEPFLRSDGDFEPHMTLAEAQEIIAECDGDPRTPQYGVAT